MTNSMCFLAALLLAALPCNLAEELRQTCPGDPAARAQALACDAPEGETPSSNLIQVNSAVLQSSTGGALRTNSKGAFGFAVTKPKSKDPEKQGSGSYGLEGAVVSYKKGKEILDAERRILGFTEDFWLLLGICVGGALICGLCVLLSVAISTSSLVASLLEVRYTDKGRIKKPVFAPNFIQRVIFRADLNPTFAARSDMASRVAVISALCSLPYYVDGLNWINELGFSFQYAVVIVVFTVYMDVGTTLSLAWYNFAGTVLPTLNCLFLYGIYPKGASDLYSSDWWFGLVNLVIFIAIMMLMKVPAGIRMFAVSWQAYFSMCYLNPDDHTHFSPGITNIVLEGAAVGPLVGTVIGCVLAVVPLCVWPLGSTMSALVSAQESSVKISWMEGALWSKMITYYSGRERSPVLDKIMGEVLETGQSLASLKDSLGTNSWWECFDLGRQGRIRAHLMESNKTLIFMHEWLRSTARAMMREEFEETHNQLMGKITGNLHKLAEKTAVLHYRSIVAAADGGVAPLGSTDPDSLHRDMAEVADAQAELAAAFVKARREVHGSDSVSTDTITEHYFVFALSVYGQYATQLAEYVLANKVSERTGLVSGFVGGITSIFEFTGWGFTFRSLIGFFLAFVIGFNGLADIISPFNGTPAGTTAFLMASDGAAGSAIMKNIARFQGTAGGTILGQLLWGTLVWCSVWGSIAGMASLTIFEYMAMYLYFSSANFGYVGVLLAAFGAQHLMLGCQSGGDAPANVYAIIEEQMLAIICVTVGDLLVGNTSPGVAATNVFYNMTERIQKGFQEFLCLDRSQEVLLIGNRNKAIQTTREYFDFTVVKNVNFHRNEILADYSMANFIGHEAPLEPRWYRTPWRAALWEDLINLSFQVGNKLGVMEYAVSEGASKGLARRAMIISPTMEKKANLFLDRASKIFLLSQKMLTHENEGMLPVSKKMTQQMVREAALDISEKECSAIISEVMSTLDSPGQLSALTEDDACQLAVVLQMMQGAMKNINQIQDKLFCQPEFLAAK